jgi:hypothetical protein
MKTIRESIGQELIWVETKLLRREYELRSGNDVLARLRWERVLGFLATAQSADGLWTFNHKGSLRLSVTVQAAGSDSEIATFRAGWGGGGFLQFPDGRRFRLARLSFWRSEWAWMDADGRCLLRLKITSASMNTVGRLEIDPTAVSVPDLSFLVLLGWYLTMVMSGFGGSDV